MCCLPLAGVSHAAELEGVEFPERQSVAGLELELVSLSRLYYKMIFTGAVAGLYLQDRDELGRVLEDVPKRLEFVYFGAVPAEDFVAAANKSLAENLDTATLQHLRDSIDSFNRLYVDIEKNDRYAITYIPGYGLELAHNGEPLGKVENPELAAVYFRIWFGKRPFNEYLKNTLLEARR